MKRILRIVTVVLVVGLFLVGAGFNLYLDHTIKAGLEAVIPKLTQSEFSVGSVSLSLLRGRVELRDVVLKNPKGFSKDNAVSVSRIYVDLKMGSLWKNKLVIQDTVVDGLHITYEGPITGGKSNLDKILANIVAFGDSALASGDDVSQLNESSDTDPTRIQVDHLLINGVKVRLQVAEANLLGVTASVPPIEMKALGQGPEGITPEEIAATVAGRILTAVMDAISIEANALKAGVEGVKEIIKVGGKVGEGLKGLFKSGS